MPLVLVRRGEIWYLRGTVRGIYVFETTKTADEGEAAEIRAHREKELFDQSVYGARAVVTFKRAAASYLEFETRSPQTADFVDRLIGHFGNTKLADINQSAADNAVAAILKPNAAPATKIRVVYTPLTAILTFAHARDWCDLRKFRRPKVLRSATRWLTPAEARNLVVSAAPHLQPLLAFLLCTGARMAEALDLMWGDVDLGAAKVLLRDTKNGRDRIASLPPAAVTVLANLPGREDEVFRRDDGAPYVDKHRLEGGQIKTAWRTACLRAGLCAAALGADGKPRKDTKGRAIYEPNATPHDLRHTWATWFHALSKDFLLLKSEGGWESLSMVERYAHLMPSDLVADILPFWGGSHPRIAPQHFAPHPRAMEA